MGTLHGYIPLRAVSATDDTALAAATMQWASKPAATLDMGLQTGSVEIIFKGTAAANATFNWTLWAYKGYQTGDDSRIVTSPALYIATGTGILGAAQTGGTNEFYADTLAITSQAWTKTVSIVDGSGNDRTARLQFDLMEHRHILCLMTKGTCTTMGADISYTY